MPRAVADQDRHPPPLEIERHLVDLVPFRDIDLLVPQYGLIQGAAQTGFEEAVDEGKLKHALAVMTVRVDMALQANAGLGERPRLVRAQHVHAAQAVDRGKVLDDDTALGHA